MQDKSSEIRLSRLKKDINASSCFTIDLIKNVSHLYYIRNQFSCHLHVTKYLIVSVNYFVYLKDNILSSLFIAS